MIERIREATLTRPASAVFEGDTHPYKENLIKFNGRIQKREPEVKIEILKLKSI